MTTLSRELARVHAARLIQGFYGQPITNTLLLAADWDGTKAGLRNILAHYRDEFAREKDRHKIGNANLGRLEIWSGTRWPDAADAWRWGYQWTPDPTTGHLTGTATMEHRQPAPTSPTWWTIAALLDYRPVLDAADPTRVRAWAPEILSRVQSADLAGGLAGIALAWVQAALREVDPAIPTTPPVEVTPEQVEELHGHAQAGRLGAVIAVGPDARVAVLPEPREGWRTLYTAAEHARLVGDYWLAQPMHSTAAAHHAARITDDANT